MSRQSVTSPLHSALELQEQGQFDDAIEAARAHLAFAQGNLRARWLLAELLERQGHDGQALAEWHRVYLVCHGRGDLRRAAMVCGNALRLRARHAHWRVRFACALLGLGRRDDAARQLEIGLRCAVHPADKRVLRRLWERTRSGSRVAA